jgi:hypothetical protein
MERTLTSFFRLSITPFLAFTSLIPSITLFSNIQMLTVVPVTLCLAGTTFHNPTLKVDVDEVDGRLVDDEDGDEEDGDSTE